MSKSRLIGPDVILLAPVEELIESARPNPPRKKRVLEHPALDIYAGNENYLVRTALIRAEGWDGGKNPPIIQSGADAADLCGHLKHADQEHMVIICINPQNKLLAIHETAVGGTSSMVIEIKHVIKVAVLTAAAAVIMVHNHPGGSPEPSREDISMTKSAKEAFKCVGIELVDHIIVALNGFTSFYSVGLL